MLCLSGCLFSGCLEETFPTTIATTDQISTSETAIGAMAQGPITAMTSYLGGTSDPGTVGYPGLMLWRDVMIDQNPVADTSYDYYNFYATLQAIGNYQTQTNFWTLYYELIYNANLTISVVDVENASETSLGYLSNALGYRAMAYMDMMRMYEYKHTGISELDAIADERDIWKLTVPIIRETTTETEGRNNPRAPFYTMYRFVLNDLNHAEEYLADITVSTKAWVSLGTVYGLKARFWLELASRFDLYPEDLTTALEHENDEDGYAALGITSAAQCYENAASYARKAINLGYTPTTQEQWHSTTTGFNSAIDSWIWAIILTSESEGVANASDWESFIAYISPEVTYGVATSTYKARRMLDAKVFDGYLKGTSDWRKYSWVDPDDAGKAPTADYQTTLSDTEWATCPAYTGFKFRPNQGNGTTYLVGNAISLPLIRVEEMYFIEAEARAHTDGVSTGVSLLESFMNSYRYTDGSYSCSATTMDDFMDEMIAQKKIEFWGEGIVMWDYKRLERAVLRDYDGTNFVQSHRHNSNDGYVAAWLNIYIPDYEASSNNGVTGKLNPDPTSYID